MNTAAIQTIKPRQKPVCEAGDFGEVAQTIMTVAEEFMA